MITVIVKFNTPHDMTTEDIKAKFIETSPIYKDTPGLVRKNYLYDSSNNTAGGCYTFKTKEEAETWFDEERLSWIKKRCSKPVVEYYESPVIVNIELERIEEYD